MFKSLSWSSRKKISCHINIKRVGFLKLPFNEWCDQASSRLIFKKIQEDLVIFSDLVQSDNSFIPNEKGVIYASRYMASP